jgi:hypothetical protein
LSAIAMLILFAPARCFYKGIYYRRSALQVQTVFVWHDRGQDSLLRLIIEVINFSDSC